jgi:hypothetical protein
MTARLLMIALDGADAQRLDRWSRDRTLPNLAALRRRSVTRPLVAAPGTTDDSLWASFQYGVGEGEHGRWHHRIRRADGLIVAPHTEERDRDAFWHELGRSGLRTAILDIPKCPPPKALNGIHLVDWLVHGRYFGEPRSFPEPLAGEVVARFGPAPPSVCGYRARAFGDAEVGEIVANLSAGIVRKRAAALHYLAAEPWDLFAVGFKEGHCGCHALWHIEDPRHPAFDAAQGERLGWPVRRLFIALDAAVGDLIAAAGPEAQIVVFTTTGIEPNGSAEHLWPGIVDRLNAVVSARCEALPHSDNCGALRLTGVQGPREREDALVRIARALRELKDARTREAVVASVGRPASEPRGSRAAMLPDLVAHWRSGIIPDAVVSQRLGRIEAMSSRRRTGNHAGDGFAILRAGRATTAMGVRTLSDLGSFAARALAEGA